MQSNFRINWGGTEGKRSQRLTEVVLSAVKKGGERDGGRRREESEGNNRQKWVQIKIRQEHLWKIHKGMKNTTP